MPNAPADRALLDTNILVYAMNEDAEHHEACRALRDQGLKGALNLCITPQVLFEYFTAVTNANVMTTPLAQEDALVDVEKLALSFPLILSTADTHERVFDLLRATGMTGRHVFDIQLAATMLANSVTSIYTYDSRFAKVPGITALAP